MTLQIKRLALLNWPAHVYKRDTVAASTLSWWQAALTQFCRADRERSAVLYDPMYRAATL